MPDRQREQWKQPGICACQKDDGPWHAHYPGGDHECARCDCRAWRPSIRPLTDAMQAVTDAQYALSAAKRALEQAWRHLGTVLDGVDGGEEFVADHDVQQNLWGRAEKKLANWVRDERRRGNV